MVSMGKQEEIHSFTRGDEDVDSQVTSFHSSRDSMNSG